MIISRSMGAAKLRDLMGGSYTEADAMRFRGYSLGLVRAVREAANSASRRYS